MAMQGGPVQLEQSDMRLDVNPAQMAKDGFSRAAIEEMHYLMKKPLAEVREETKRGVELPGHKMVQAAMETHPAMLRQNDMPGCLPWPNGTAKNPPTCRRHKRPGTLPPKRRRKQTPELTPELTPQLMPPLPGTPPTSTCNTSGVQHLEIINLQVGDAYSHTSLPCAECFTLDTSAQDSEQDTDFHPDTLPDEGTSTG